MVRKFTFKKYEKLTSKKKIDLLFKHGKIIKIFPLKFIWIQSVIFTEFPVEILFSIPKKLIPKAVTRNKIKRQLKEIYRLNKFKIYEELKKKNIQISVIIVYMSKEVAGFDELKKQMIKGFENVLIYQS